jgi:YVTN family beta-propeller protein
MRRHLRGWSTAIAALLVLAACSSTGTVAPNGATPSASITADARPADPHESMNGMAMPSGQSALVPVPSSSVPSSSVPSSPATSTSVPTPAAAPPAPPPAPPAVDVLPGMPPVTDPNNIYSDAGANMLGPFATQSKAYAYVPNSKSGDVWVIDQASFQVVAKFPVGIEVQHVVPSYDMSSLYATDDIGNVIRRIDPVTGQAGETIPVADPYNMYFTPDGKSAISVAEALRSLVWYDPVTWQETDRVRYPDCSGIDHGDFTPDGKIAVFSCEFAGRVAVIDMQTHQLIRMIDLPVRNTTMGPQDLRIAPDGSKFFIADSDSDGVWVLDKDLQTVTRHIDTGDGAHGLYFSRDAKQLYVTNRHEGSISVLDAYTGDVITKWQIPGGGSPDMGNVSADGSQLWLSGRYDNVVYVLSTADGGLLAKIPVGNGPHGLALMPQPGRYSIGHTGITR